MLGAGALLNLLAAAEAAANNEQHGLGTHQIKCREPAVARCALYSAATLCSVEPYTVATVCSRSVRSTLDFCFSNGHSWRSKAAEKVRYSNPYHTTRTTTPQERLAGYR